MLPKINGVVRLTRDVELKFLPSGSALANLGLAASKKYKSQGQEREDKCFLNATIFGKLAEVANTYLKKGSQVYIDGEELTESWSDQEGVKKYKQVVRINSFEMLGGKQDSQTRGQNHNAPQQQYNQQPQQNYNAPQQQQQNSGMNNSYEQNIPTIDIDNDEIPFKEDTAPIHNAAINFVTCLKCDKVQNLLQVKDSEHDGDICGTCFYCKTNTIFFPCDKNGQVIEE